MVKGTDEIASLSSKGIQTEKSGREKHSPPGTGCAHVFNLSRRLGRTLAAKKLVDPNRDRAKKICAIRKRIEKGTYRVDFERVAESVLHALLDDEIASGMGHKILPVVDAISLS